MFNDGLLTVEYGSLHDGVSLHMVFPVCFLHISLVVEKTKTSVGIQGVAAM
jgi:hypothetical protein